MRGCLIESGISKPGKGRIVADNWFINEAMQPQTHLETVAHVLAAGRPLALSPGDALIQQSWLRCAREHGLNPASGRREHIAPMRAVRDSRERQQAFFEVADAGLGDLHAHVAELGYVALLADGEGTTVSCLGAESRQSPFARAGLKLGAMWTETDAGTNGIGTCLVEDRTLTCHRQDHFFASHVGLSCTASPLHDAQGRIVGVLDLSALSSPEQRESQHLARHLTELYARRIEDAHFVREFGRHWLLRLGSRASFVGEYAELLLAVDDDGVIHGANTRARQQLQVLDDPRAPLTGQTLAAVFRERFADLHRSADPRRLTTWAERHYHGVLSAPRLARASSTPRLSRASGTPPAATTTSLRHLAHGDATMQQLLHRAERFAARPIDVLILGETGTGKEWLARALHAAGPRRDQAFVAINCAAIPESLIESELFGYTAGTFTGARARGMTGLLQRANGGTLFLDEIGDMPLALQTRLLRVLSEREVRPLGAEQAQRLDLRIIAATHQALEQQVARGLFREDLYYRLSGARLSLPPLRDRSDLPALIDSVLARECEALDCHATLGPAARALLLGHRWPGNLRELRNALRYALALIDAHEQIEPGHLPENLHHSANALAPSAPANTLPDAAARLHACLQRRQWNITAAARELGLNRATIYRQMQRHGIVDPRRRHDA